MKKILIILGTLAIFAVGGGLLFLYFNPQYQKKFSSNYDEMPGYNTPLKWPTELFVSEGFKRWNDKLAFRWISSPSSLCTAKACNSIEVISRFGCPTNLYAQVSLIDSENRNVGFTNRMTSGIRPNQKALLEFRTYQTNFSTWRLTKITCY